MKVSIERKMKEYNIAALTIARGIGGSTKNRCLWEICGKSLLEWAIKPLRESKYIDRIIMATESEEIEAAARKCGADVIRRPLNRVLDRDRNFSQGLEKRLKPRSFVHREKHYINIDFDYVLYCLMELEGYFPDLILGFAADSPLGKCETVNRILRTFFEDEYCTTVMDIYEVAPKFWMINPKDKRLFPIYRADDIGLPRQMYPELYKTGIYSLTGSSGKMVEPDSWPFWYLKYSHVIVSPEEGFHIHNKEDLFLAECYMKRRLENES